MEKIRNFCILSHINHGKSTLADRFLELTKTVPKEKMREQFLDSMDLERERGITIKMQPVRMKYTLNAIPYTLNLIDTPGHVDFSYEVSRSLAAVEGAVLLVDATKGIQAQTLANFNLAKVQGLEIIPVINKIDLAAARIEEVKTEAALLVGKKPEEVLEISAKLGTGVEKVLGKVVEIIPAPKGAEGAPFRALIFNSQYNTFKGVVAFVKVVDGEIRQGDDILMLQSKVQAEAKEVGFFVPHFLPQTKLTAGEIGYIATGIKEIEKVRVGETITPPSFKGKALPGYLEPKPVVFASIYPESADDYSLLKDGLAKLKLNDASLSFEPESKEALGRGFRCGFLGSLHLEIIVERLRREFQLELVISSPSVIYKIIDKKDKERTIFSPGDWPNESEIKETLEPWVSLELMAPKSYLGRLMELGQKLRGKYIKTDYFGENTVLLSFEVPLSSIIVNFYDNLKGATQGYGSLNYQFLDYRTSDLVRLDILIAGVKEEAFSQIVVREEVEKEGRRIIKKLKEVLPPQLFQVPLQAVVSGKILARETIRAKRKDVIAPLYGGDYTRKRKLLEQQKKGKKELQEKGGVRVPSRVFLEVFKSR